MSHARKTRGGRMRRRLPATHNGSVRANRRAVIQNALDFGGQKRWRTGLHEDGLKSACAKRIERKMRMTCGGDQRNPSGGRNTLEARRRFNTADPRQIDVEHDEVRLHTPGQLDGLEAVRADG